MEAQRLSPLRLLPADPAPPPDHPAGLGADSGPNPVVRAIVGLLVGLAAGAVAAAVTPRPHRARRATTVTTGGPSPEGR